MGNSNLTKRQLEILSLVGRFRFLSFRCLSHYYGITEKAVLLLAYRLLKRGYIRVEKIFHNGDKFMLLTKLGVEFLGFRYHKKINRVNLIHDNYTYLYAINALKGGSVVKLEHELKEESGLSFNKIANTSFPDIIVNGDEAIEVELTLKNITRLKQKILKLESEEGIKRIKWLSNNALVLDKVARNCFSNKHEFYRFNDDILDLIPVYFNRTRQEFSI